MCYNTSGNLYYNDITGGGSKRMHFVEAKGILSSRNGMNIYRGCTHGCIYCDSRSVCYRMNHDFEDVEVKQNAPILLDAALRAKRERCMIATGSMSDPYMPIELQLGLTRACAQTVLSRGFGFTVITKSTNVLRDIDLLDEINRRSKCVVQMTLTTYDEGLCSVLEPNAPTTNERFQALCALRERGIPTVVWLSPFLPFINDTEENVKGLMKYCAMAGVHAIIYFGAGLTLREGNREYYYKRLDEHFPGLSGVYTRKYLNAYGVMSDNAQRLDALVAKECEESGIVLGNERVFGYLSEFRKNRVVQISFFDSQ